MIRVGLEGITLNLRVILEAFQEQGAQEAIRVIGGVGVGIFPDFSVAGRLASIVDTSQPNPELRPLYDRLYGVFNRAYDAFVPLFEELAEFYPGIAGHG